MRNHSPIVLENFNGLWRRGDEDSCPPDHFTNTNNIEYLQSGFRTRYGIYPLLPWPNITRIYTFVQESGESIIGLDVNGNIYDSGSPTPLTPILTITGMTDFAFVSIAGRAFLTPSDGRTGLENEFVYLYEGDGSYARKAAGAAPIDSDGALAAANSATAGNVETGVHIFAVVYETSSGFLTSFGPDTLPTVTADGTKKVDLTNIPVSANPAVTTVHIVATRAIPVSTYTGNTRGYNFYFIPSASVTNGTTTLTVNFYDSELLEDATHLTDLFEEIPATVGLNSYHNRMTAWATFDDISVCYVSFPGEPEAISQIDGLIIVPLNGNPITHCQEFRDILYCFKQTQTFAYNDNGDVPSSWPQTVLDQGIGCSVHGVATVLDSGGVNVDYLIIVDYSGIMLFNGLYTRPELSWKIQDLWLALARSRFSNIDIVNDSLNQKLYLTLPNGSMLLGDYSDGLNPKDIKWAVWHFSMPISSLTLYSTDTLVLSSNLSTVAQGSFAVFNDTFSPQIWDSNADNLIYEIPVSAVNNFGRKVDTGEFATVGFDGTFRIYDTSIELTYTETLTADYAYYLQSSAIRFYTFFRNATNHWIAQQRSKLGAIVKTFTCPTDLFTDEITVMAIAQNDSILYYCGGIGEGVVKRYDIAAEVNLTNFLNLFVTPYDILALPNGNVLVSYPDPAGNTAGWLVELNSSGLVLHTLNTIAGNVLKLALNEHRSNQDIWGLTETGTVLYHLNTVGTGITITTTLVRSLLPSNSFIVMDAIPAASILTGVYYLTESLRHDTLYYNLSLNEDVVDVMIPLPSATTYYIGDKEENILHFGAVKMRVNGEGNLQQYLISLDNVESSDALAEQAMTPASSREPTTLTNFISQRAKYRVGISEIDEWFKFSRILIYVKPIYTQYPG